MNQNNIELLALTYTMRSCLSIGNISNEFNMLRLRVRWGRMLRIARGLVLSHFDWRKSICTTLSISWKTTEKFREKFNERARRQDYSSPLSNSKTWAAR